MLESASMQSDSQLVCYTCYAFLIYIDVLDWYPYFIVFASIYFVHLSVSLHGTKILNLPPSRQMARFILNAAGGLVFWDARAREFRHELNYIFQIMASIGCASHRWYRQTTTTTPTNANGMLNRADALHRATDARIRSFVRVTRDEAQSRGIYTPGMRRAPPGLKMHLTMCDDNANCGDGTKARRFA